MPDLLILPAVLLGSVLLASAFLLFRDVHATRLRERVGSIRSETDEQTLASSGPILGIRLAGPRSNLARRLMQLLRFNPEIEQQNLIAGKLVILIACGVGLVGFFYGRAFVGLP